MNLIKLYSTGKIFFLILILILASCSKDSDEPTITEITVTTSDFLITIDENPESGQVIGTVTGTTNEGAVSFSIIEQFPESAFSIDPSSGELKVAVPTLFNFEVHPELTGTVKVANGTLFEIAAVTINLNDLEEERIYEGDVWLASQDEINDFGNSGFTHITGNLRIGNSTYNDIEDLSPLLNIEKIDNALYIYGCSRLTNTNGLRNISHIGGGLSFESNPLLEKITDLQNLTVLEGFLNISGSLYLSNISGLDQLIEIKGVFNLSDSMLKNLDALENLNIIKEGLTITYNFNLTNVDGLSNLNAINDKIYISYNDLLTNLDGFSNLTATVSNLHISNNISLENLNGLHNIDTTVLLYINSNYSLKNIDGLISTQDVNGVEISRNNSLLNLQGLSNLTSIGQNGLYIENNIKLENLNGLARIDQIEGQLNIKRNYILRDFCTLQGFLINGNPGSYTVSDNFYNPTMQDIIDGNCSF